jgi:hypothetical protein
MFTLVLPPYQTRYVGYLHVSHFIVNDRLRCEKTKESEHLAYINNLLLLFSRQADFFEILLEKGGSTLYYVSNQIK